MMNRRTILGGLAAAFSATAAARKARASTAPRPSLPYDVEPRGTVGMQERLPSLDLESRHEFLTGFRAWAQGPLGRAAQERANAIFKAEGIDPEGDVPLEKVQAVLEGDPIVGASVRYWITGQQHCWKLIQDEFHANADAYMAELDAADKAGPGSVTLDPEFKVPEYASHEIHIQPGGYVGDPFAGYIYHYGTNHFRLGDNDQDQRQKLVASTAEPPEDGRLLRILDLGCGPGRLTVALKDRFPAAEVWGVDVSGPMVRYAHMRAADLGKDVHFAQALAEETGFPDGHFDMVFAYILFHEVPASATKAIVKEVRRITRPGGVFQSIDFPAEQRPPTPYRSFRRWWDHRWNNEVWRYEFQDLHFPNEIANAGFAVRKSKKGMGFLGSIHATRNT